jgi:hypothetical protein
LSKWAFIKRLFIAPMLSQLKHPANVMSAARLIGGSINP